MTTALVAATLTGGCADEQEPLIVLNAVAMDGGMCLADPGGTRLAFGQLDVYDGSPYLLAVVLQNQLLSQTNSNSGVEDGELQLRDVDVKLTGEQGIIDAVKARDSALVDFTVTLASDSLGPGDSAALLVEVIPRQTSSAIREELELYEPGTKPQVTAHLVFHARRTGNAVGGIGDIEAREYTFPIKLCIGCLAECSTCPDGVCPDQVDSWDGGLCGNMQDSSWVPNGCGPLEEEM